MVDPGTNLKILQKLDTAQAPTSLVDLMAHFGQFACLDLIKSDILKKSLTYFDGIMTEISRKE